MVRDLDHSASCARRAELTAKYGDGVVESLEAVVSFCDEAALLVGRGRDAFEEDVLLRRASEAIFNRIGDTIRSRLPSDLLEEYPRQPWSNIIGMRVRMAHIYTENDRNIMWNALVEHVPQLLHYVSHGILDDR